jgi:hypothetical protein
MADVRRRAGPGAQVAYEAAAPAADGDSDDDERKGRAHHFDGGAAAHDYGHHLPAAVAAYNGAASPDDFDEPATAPLSSYKPAAAASAAHFSGVPTYTHPAGRAQAATAASGSWFDRNEAWVPWLLLAISAVTRFYRLDQPRGVVFDEGHFGRFTNQYTDGQFLFDIHPPLGKLVFYWVGRLVGYDHTVCDYAPKDHRELYQPTCKFIFIRATAAAFGTFTPLWVYHIARNWGTSVAASFLAGSFVVFDILNVMEARLILVDSQLVFWCALALLVAQMWWRRLNEHAAAEEAFEGRFHRRYDPLWDRATAADPRLMTEVDRWLWAVGCGVVFGNAISVKWTGLATPGECGGARGLGMGWRQRGGRWCWADSVTFCFSLPFPRRSHGGNRVVHGALLPAARRGVGGLDTRGRRVGTHVRALVLVALPRGAQVGCVWAQAGRRRLSPIVAHQWKQLTAHHGHSYHSFSSLLPWRSRRRRVHVCRVPAHNHRQRALRP